MSKLKLVIFSIFILYNLSSTAQVKEDIYLIFNNGSEDTCSYSLWRDGRDKKNINFNHQFKYGCFVFLKEYFQITPKSMIEELNKKELIKLNIIKIDYFFRKREETEVTQLANPNSLFNKIFVLVQNIDGNYLKFEVQWKEMFID